MCRGGSFGSGRPRGWRVERVRVGFRGVALMAMRLMGVVAWFEGVVVVRWGAGKKGKRRGGGCELACVLC